jgi:hypothetical protein
MAGRPGRPTEVETMRRYVLAGLLVVHGLIHVIGVAMAWNLATPEGISTDTLFTLGDGAVRALGLVWMAATVLLVAAGIAAASDRRVWRRLAVWGSIASLVVVLVWWEGAWRGAIVDGLVLIVALIDRQHPVVTEGRQDETIEQTSVGRVFV